MSCGRCPWDNRRRNRADRKYLLVEASPVRARARAAMRALLQEQLGLNARAVDIAMHRGLEALLWRPGGFPSERACAGRADGEEASASGFRVPRRASLSSR
jgi:hypothetical protein